MPLAAHTAGIGFSGPGERIAGLFHAPGREQQQCGGREARELRAAGQRGHEHAEQPERQEPPGMAR